MKSNKPQVTAIVLNWNNFKDSKECIRTLREQTYPNLNLLLVDNGSTDGSVERLEERFSDLNIYRNDENLGFTGGMNRGIEAALSNGADYVLLVNNDISVQNPEVVAELVEKLRSTVGVAALSPRIGNESAKRGSLSDSLPSIRNGRTGHRMFYRHVEDPDISYGCHYGFVLLSSEVLKTVGTFDERYFLYFEDIEHGARIEDAGYFIGTHNGVSVNHESHGSSSSPIGEIPSYYGTRNRLLFIRQYNSGIELLFVSIWFVWWLCTRLVYRLYKQNKGGTKAMLRGLIDGALGRTGKGPYP